MRILVTGGAGFIGSNLVKALLEDSRVEYVRVLDNLATGFRKNISEFLEDEKFEFVEGDIRDYKTCLDATKGMDGISHQAALGSVPRSIKDPLTTNAVNITGTLNIFKAAHENNIKRVVYAASSSTYGDSESLPKIEDKIGRPLSPYAVSKYVMELYGSVFHDLYNIDFVGLRYFNVFGPKQDPNGAYAAVIPLFFKHAINGTDPVINGDGTYSRDFTYVVNAVDANVLALSTSDKSALNQVYNIAYGERTTLNTLWTEIKKISKSKSKAIYGPNREGDIPHSLASIEKAKNLMGYNPSIDLKTGLEKAYIWYVDKK